mgnify:CR=1 FL=1
MLIFNMLYSFCFEIIKQILIKNCRNFQAIFYLQTMLYLKSICFVILFVFAPSLHAQDNALVIKTPQNLDDVLERKLSLDKKRLAKNQYTIQIFSGNYEAAKVYLDSFSNAFPSRYAKLSFETPNYKIRVGKFGTRLEGSQTLDTLRVKFPEAFLLKP